MKKKLKYYIIFTVIIPFNQNQFMFFKDKFFYIVESIEWVVLWEGKYISRNIRDLFGINIKVLRQSKLAFKFLKNKVLHFGSSSVYLSLNPDLIHKNNSIVLTWYHVVDNGAETQGKFNKIADNIDVLHTSCSISKNKLIEWGADKSKIVTIPIGIDLDLFYRPGKEEKNLIRKKLGIPENTICIGSFQKDGVGWDEGNEPKLIKGPDVFCDVVEQLNKKLPVSVLLTGPARGYVKNRLGSAGIPFKHYYLKNSDDIPRFYRALDIYIISSRIEGGPKSLAESWASGVPVVATDVGMVHDYAKNGFDAMISSADDTEKLVENSLEVIKENKLREILIENGIKTVKQLDWKIVARSYYEKIYSKFLN